MAIVLAIVLAAFNSLVHPFPGSRPGASGPCGGWDSQRWATTSSCSLIIWLGAPLSATNPIGFMCTAIFLTLLAAPLNHLVGFKPKEQPEWSRASLA